MPDSLIKILAPTSDWQWVFMIISVLIVLLILGLFFIWIKFKSNTQQLKPIDNNLFDKELSDYKKEIKDEFKEARYISTEHGNSISEIMGRLERLELLSDSRNRDFSEEIGGFKAKIYDKLIVIEHFIGEVSEIVKNRKKDRPHHD